MSFSPYHLLHGPYRQSTMQSKQLYVVTLFCHLIPEKIFHDQDKDWNN